MINQILGMGGGLDFHGEWFNKRTGEKVTVKLAIQDGENMKIILMNGQLIDMMIFSLNYLQVTDDIYDENGNKISSAPVHSNEVKIQQTSINNVSSNKISLDEPLFNDDNLQYDLDKPINAQCNINQSKKSDSKFDMIDKILKVNKPSIDIILKWDNPPIAELKMLNRYFDISTKDISEYIKSNVTIDDLYISEQINNLLEKN